LVLGCSHGEAPPILAAPKSKVWSPGDPIPGWEDSPCDAPPAGAGHLSTTFPDGWSARASIRGNDTGEVTSRSLSLLLVDCTTIDCSGLDRPQGVASHADLSLVDHSGGTESRGQGVYGPGYADEPLGGYSEGDSQLLYWTATDTDTRADNALGYTCLSRVRPDMIEGVLLLRPYDIGWNYYRDTQIRISFSVTFADHAHVDDDEPTDAYTEPEGADIAHFAYNEIDYDEAWPWELITDKSIRDAVYDRYTPWNVP
jgi:hypothetical protein